jgi:hypothetical protein
LRKTFLNNWSLLSLLTICLLLSWSDSGWADGTPRFYQHLSPEAPGKSARQLETSGWSVRGHPALSMNPPIDWSADPNGDANWRYQLNAMYPLAAAFVFLEWNYDADLHRFVRAVFRDWFEYHIVEDTHHKYRWHDMSTGIRGAYLAQLIHLEREHGSVDNMGWMLEAANLHIEVLSDPAQLAAHNHAIYQLVGIAALCETTELAICVDALSYAQAEFGRIFATQFNAEGMHLEHSPAYHGIAVRVFENIRRSGLLELSDEHELWLTEAEENLQYLLHPDGGFAEVGDTESWQSRTLGRYHEQAEWLVSGGRSGVRPVQGARTFPQSGLVSIRDGGEDLSSFLFFTAAHHSRVHKHLDTGSFEWSDRGRRILVDSGKWGYDPGPEREYVRSPEAHNVVKTQGVRLSPGHVPAEQASIDVREFDGVYIVRSWLPAPRRLLDAEHLRLLVLRPDTWLIVVDLLKEVLPSNHTQWFQLPPDIEVEQADRGFLFDVAGSRRMRVLPLLQIDSSTVARGESPDLLGWYSNRYRELVPAAQIGFQAAGRRVGFATLFRWLSDGTGSLRSEGAFDGKTLSLCWRAGDRVEGMEMSNLDGDLNVRSCGVEHEST